MEESIPYWLTVTHQSLVKSLKVSPKSAPAKESNMEGCLYFKANEIEKANIFLRKLKKFLKNDYPFVEDRAPWMNEEEWLEEGMIQE